MGKEAAKKGGAAWRYHEAKGGENVGCGKRHALFCNHLRMVLFVFGLMGSFFLLDSLTLTIIHHFNLHCRGSLQRRRWIVPQNVKSEIPVDERAEKIMYVRLLALASAAISKNEIHDSIELFEEPYNQTSTWRYCSDQGN